jgi:hypothetical protein
MRYLPFVKFNHCLMAVHVKQTHKVLEDGLPYTKLDLVELIHDQGRKNVEIVTQSARKCVLSVW